MREAQVQHLEESQTLNSTDNSFLKNSTDSLTHSQIESKPKTFQTNNKLTLDIKNKSNTGELYDEPLTPTTPVINTPINPTEYTLLNKNNFSEKGKLYQCCFWLSAQEEEKTNSVCCPIL